jgi:hypothetical protein
MRSAQISRMAARQESERELATCRPLPDPMIQFVSQDPYGIKMSASSGLVLTGAQVRGARALLRWSTEELATRSRLGTATIKRAEAHDGPVTSTPVNVQAMRNTFEAAMIIAPVLSQSR